MGSIQRDSEAENRKQKSLLHLKIFGQSHELQKTVDMSFCQGLLRPPPKDDVLPGKEQHRSPVAILGVSVLSYFLKVSFGFP